MRVDFVKPYSNFRKTNLKQKNNVLSPNQSNGYSIQNMQPKLRKGQKINFGVLSEEIMILIITDLIMLAGVVAFAAVGFVVNKVYQANVDKKAREEEIKRVERERLNSIDAIANKLNISKKKAQRYHDKFIGIANIKPSEDGHEKGLNAIMGYGVEKYNAAMKILAPIIDAQNNNNEESRKIIPDGVLFYGPGGSGKTYMAEHLVEHLEHFGVNVEEISLDEEDHKQNVANIINAFENAEKRYKKTGKYTAIRFKEDIEDFFKDRSKDDEFIRETRTLLKYADRCASKGAVWITTANNPRKMDPSILRRLTIKMPIGKMKDFQIGDMLKYEVIGHEGKNFADKLDYQKIVDYIKSLKQDFTPDEYRIFVQNASAMGKISEESIKEAIDEDMVQKFNSDQEYVDSIDGGNLEE